MEKNRNSFKDLSWSSINWVKSYISVRRLQCKIYKAQKANKKRKVHGLQKQLIDNPHSKYIAVAMASDIQKKKILQTKHAFISNLDKIKIVKSLTLNRNVKYIGKKELKNLYQTSKQYLLRLALDPEWENRIKDVCYGGRISRTVYDSIDYLSSSIESLDHIYTGDFKNQFRKVNSTILLENMEIHPIFKKGLIKFLNSKAFKLEQNEVELSICYGEQSLLAGLLVNITCNRLTLHISEALGRKLKSTPLVFLFYGYRYVVAHQNIDVITSCVSEMQYFLNNLCPEANEGSTKYKHYYGNFVFLGFHIFPIKENKPFCRVTSSKESQQKLIKTTGQIIRINRSISSYKLISKLTPYIFKWASYFRYYISKTVLDRLDQTIHSQIKSWVFRRTANQSKTKTKLKYFPKNKIYTFQGKSHKGEWILFGIESSLNGATKNKFLPKMTWIKKIDYLTQFNNISVYDVYLDK